MIETALIEILAADPTVSGLIGNRIRPFTDTDAAAYPDLSYWRTNTQRPISNDGPTGQNIATIQLDAWAADLGTCWQVLDAVRLALEAVKTPGLVAGGYQIDSIRWEDQTDQINVPVLPGRNKPVQRHTGMIVVSYTEKTAQPAFSAGFAQGFE